MERAGQSFSMAPWGCYGVFAENVKIRILVGTSCFSSIIFFFLLFSFLRNDNCRRDDRGINRVYSKWQIHSVGNHLIFLNF